MRKSLLLPSAFFLKALVYYLAFLGAWMIIGDWYADAYRLTATGLFRRFPPHGTVLITAAANPTRLLDSEYQLKNNKTRVKLTQTFSARYHGYAPVRLMLSLILASPFPWSRRIWAVIWGLLLIHAWIVFELALMIFDGYTGDHGAAMYSFGPRINESIEFITHVAADTIVPRYVVPCLAWILVTFRRGDWDNFVKTLQAKDK